MWDVCVPPGLYSSNADSNPNRFIKQMTLFRQVAGRPDQLTFGESVTQRIAS